MEQSILHVGLDVHKETIAVALAEAGLREDVREHGKIANTAAALKALTEKRNCRDFCVRDVAGLVCE